MTQSEALSILKMGHNVFLTGGAGSGKTYVLNTYIKYLSDHGIHAAITASTGIAATHMRGMTIHAWSGIGIRERMSDYDIEALEEKKYLWDRYETVKVLIIDEISMLSGDFLDMLDRVCRSFKRKPDSAFGGIQIVLSGDLFQLPPVSKGNGEPMLVTDSQAWKDMRPAICYITEQHRQEDDDFTGILNAIRGNAIDDSHIELLNSRLCDYDGESFQNITKLFTHNANVDAINEQELCALESEEIAFQMHSRGKPNVIETLKKSCLAPETLKLKIGTEVMFVKNNFDKGYVNGTRGTVVDFDKSVPVVETLDGIRIHMEPETWIIEDNGKEIASISQIPLRHAWAITVHKSQGMSLDAAVIDLSNTFAYGMGYVALSRVRKLSGVHLVGEFTAEALAVNPRILKLDAQFQKISDASAERLSQLGEQKIAAACDEFIVRSGGTLEIQTAKKKSKNTTGIPTHLLTYNLIAKGTDIADTITIREITLATLIGHLEKALQSGLPIDARWLEIPKKDQKVILDAFKKTKQEKLTPVKKYLDKQGHNYDFNTIRLVRLLK